MAKPSTTKKRVFLGRDAWVKHVATWKDSGLTQPAYAKQAGINRATFCNWVAKLRNERKDKNLPVTSSAFVPVNITSTSFSAADKDSDLSCDLTITLPNGIQCRFPTQHSPQQIVPWIDYLRRLS